MPAHRVFRVRAYLPSTISGIAVPIIMLHPSDAKFANEQGGYPSLDVSIQVDNYLNLCS